MKTVFMRSLTALAVAALIIGSSSRSHAQEPTVTAVISANNPATLENCDEAVPFEVYVLAGASFPNTGEIDLYVDGVLAQENVPVSGSLVTVINHVFPGPGTYTITASYTNGEAYAPSDSEPYLQEVVCEGGSGGGGGGGEEPPCESAAVLSVSNATAMEGDSGTTEASFEVTLSGDSCGRTVSFTYQTGDLTATAGSDYTAAAGTYTFPEGQTTATITVQVLGDVDVEADETFTLTLISAVDASIPATPATGTITDDDQVIAPPCENTATLSIADASAAEGDTGTTFLRFTVSLSGETCGETVTVSYSTANGTATAGSDYVTTVGLHTFAEGQTTFVIEVPVLGDDVVEPDETLTLNLVTSAGGVIADGTGTGTIVNDDREDPSQTPTTAQDCQKDRWKDYGIFKNHGDCVSYVATHGKNEPGQNVPNKTAPAVTTTPTVTTTPVVTTTPLATGPKADNPKRDPAPVVPAPAISPVSELGARVREAGKSAGVPTGTRIKLADGSWITL